MRLLLVEDDTMIGEAVLDALRAEHFAVDWVRDGEMADTALQFYIPVMIAVAAACLPIFFTGRIISRGNGAMLFGYYIAYTLYLVFTAQRIHATETLNTAMLWFVIPLTMLTLAIGVVSELRKKAAA